MRQLPELLVPAGSLEVLKVAVLYGADAVYIGGDAYSLRAKSKNFDLQEMREGIDFAHERGVKVYVTVNIFAHDGDLDGIRIYLRELAGLKPDALLISDPGVFMIAREEAPDIPVHISTQANNTNYGTFRFWHDHGAARVVAARELSLEEIADIRAHIPADMEIEVFVHGAMCISYSGRCLLSNYFTGRDANQGACTHPCRWKYAVVEETRPGEYLPVEENERGTYIFNSKDLCMIGYLPELIKAGVDSLKIEGRMKTALYVADVARTYRQALDDLAQDPALYHSRISYYEDQIARCTHRNFTTGFFFGKPSGQAQIYESSTYEKPYIFLGIIEGAAQDEDLSAAEAAASDLPSSLKGMYCLEQKNKFCVGDRIEIMRPDGRDEMVQVLAMRDEEGNPMDSCPHPKQRFYVDLGVKLERFDILRMPADGGRVLTS